MILQSQTMYSVQNTLLLANPASSVHYTGHKSGSSTAMCTSHQQTWRQQ